MQHISKSSQKIENSRHCWLWKCFGSLPMEQIASRITFYTLFCYQGLKEGPLSFHGLHFLQYLAGCRDSNPICCDCMQPGVLPMSYTHLFLTPNNICLMIRFCPRNFKKLTRQIFFCFGTTYLHPFLRFSAHKAHTAQPAQPAHTAHTAVTAHTAQPTPDAI